LEYILPFPHTGGIGARQLDERDQFGALGQQTYGIPGCFVYRGMDRNGEISRLVGELSWREYRGELARAVQPGADSMIIGSFLSRQVFGDLLFLAFWNSGSLGIEYGLESG